MLNKVFLGKANRDFKDNLVHAKTYDLVKTPKESISASQLTAGKKHGQDHFFVREISDALIDNLTTNYIDPLFEEAVRRMEDVNLELLLSMLKVDTIRNRATLSKCPGNKAEVRLIGDPLVRLFRQFNAKFKVCTAVLSCPLTYVILLNYLCLVFTGKTGTANNSCSVWEGSRI